MFKKLLSLVVAALLALSFAGSVYADTITGKVTKIVREGREITVKSKDKEVTVGISASRTKLEGVGDRSEIKEGMSVAVEYDGDRASKVSVTKK